MPRQAGIWGPCCRQRLLSHAELSAGRGPPRGRMGVGPLADLIPLALPNFFGGTLRTRPGSDPNRAPSPQVPPCWKPAVCFVSVSFWFPCFFLFFLGSCLWPYCPLWVVAQCTLIDPLLLTPLTWGLWEESMEEGQPPKAPR